jgi:uncharacterized protein
VKAVNASGSRGKAGKVTRELIDQAAHTIVMHTDPQWGGLASRVKFPEPVVWEFLLHQYARARDPQLRQVLTLTLDSMWDGGMYDHLGGGWHRYSTDRQWLVPHFEKMLYDNAQLASLYIDAARVLREPRYAAVARDTLDFMLREMQLLDGGFAASFDASTTDGEGAYYVWTPGQLREVAGDDAEELARVLGISEEPNFRDHHGKVSGSVVTRRAEDPVRLFAKYRPALLTARSKRLKPTRDEKVVTAWNGLAISALAKAYIMYSDERYLTAATAAIDFILQQHHDKDTGTLLRASTDGTPGAVGVLDDYVFFAYALLDLAEARRELLSQAIEWLDFTQHRFEHPEAGLYYEAEDTLSPFARRQIVSDTVEPSGNSMYMSATLKRAQLTGSHDGPEYVQRQLAAFAGSIAANPLEMTKWLSAACLLLGPYYLVVIAGDEAAADTQALIDSWRATPALNSLLCLVPAGGVLDSESIAAEPVLTGKGAIDGRATAYVCTHGTCSAPVHNPAELRELLLAH